MTESIANRIDNITLIEDKYEQEVLPAPPSCKIELTRRCNFSCGFCAHGTSTVQKGDMDKEFYKRVVKEMHEAGVKELGLFYIGESLLCDWLPEAVAYAKEVGFPYVFLTTNGSLLTPEKAEALMAAGLDSLKFSYNNADAEQFKAITSVSPKWFDILNDNIKGAWEVREKGGYKTKLYASSIQYDGIQHERMQAAVDKITPYVDEHYWLPLYSFGGQQEGFDYAPTAGNQGRLGALRQPLPCWSAFKEAHITYDGKMSICCFGHGPDECFVAADLNDVSFMDGWNSTMFQETRRAHLKKDIKGTVCENCLAYQ